MKSVLKSCFSIACAEARQADSDFINFIRLAMCLADSQSDEAKYMAVNSNMPSKKLWKVISANKLKSLFATSPETTAVLPQPIPRRLEWHLKKQRKRQPETISELTELVGALEAANISVLAMKGPLIGKRLYGDPLRRSFWDLDLLVDTSQLHEAIELFAGRGYVLKGGRRHLSNHRLRTNHAVELRREKFRIDLHWHLRNVPAYRFDMPNVWAEQVTEELAGKHVCMISDEHSLLMLLLSVVDDIARGKLRLKHMLDLHLMVRRLGTSWDWKQFFAARSRDNTLSTCVNGLAVLEGISPVGSFPLKLRQEMQIHKSLIVTRDPAQCHQLLLQPRKSHLAWMWMCQTYPSASWRDWTDLWRLNLPHVGSAPRTLWRCALRSSQTVRFLGNYRRVARMLRTYREHRLYGSEMGGAN